MKIRVHAVIDGDVVKVEGTGNPWADMGPYLEVLSFLATKSVGWDERGKTIEDIAEYARQYIIKAAPTYTDVTPGA